MGDEDDYGDEEEMEGESMLRLMQEIKQMREINNQGGQVFLDEERRKNAEALILKLSKYMNLNDDEEDFDDDEDF